MQIICSHENLDFDGLASMVGVQKLYPEAKMVLPGKLSQPVKEFLALYKDTFEFYRDKDLEDEIDAVDEIILVDTNQLHRTSKIAAAAVTAGSKLIVYDHHPQTLALSHEYSGVIELIGATATLIVERIQAEGLDLHPIEATVLALGIYQDTGSLQFLGTTSRDVKAVAYLLEAGAKLQVINTFLDRPLNLEQQQLYNLLLSHCQEKWINGNYVLLATAEIDHYVGGMAVIAGKLGELYNADVILLAVASRRQVDLIARSKVEWARVDRLMSEFGGGGHSKAASAKIKGVSLSEVVTKLENLCPAHITPPLTAKDLMNSPVKSVRPYQTIDEAARLMLRYGHTGMPVVENGQLVGIISRRDVDKGIRHDLGHAPIKAYMSRNVKIIAPDTPVTRIEELMIKNDIGRLPVCESNQLVGIVTRSDLLRTMHEGYQGKFTTNFRERCPITGHNTRELLPKIMNPNLVALLQMIGERGYQRGEQVFLVGGIVRDLIIGAPNVDIDIVVEGSAPELARGVAEELNGSLRVHEAFQTATVTLANDFKIDFATTRTEFYAYPAALPTIESAKLREDLYRRDFTVNALAISLNPQNFGQLIDYFCGYSDLAEGLIRVLHNLSFVEDPTRIIRALRFAVKFGWQVENETFGFMQRALKERRLQAVSPTRLWNEVKNILLETNPLPILKKLSDLGIDRQLFGDPGWNENFFAALKVFREAVMELSSQDMGVPWRGYLAIMLAGKSWNDVDTMLKAFALRRKDRKMIADVFLLREQLPTTIGPDDRPSMAFFHAHWDNMKAETILAWAALAGSRACLEIARWYLENKEEFKPVLSGHDLLALGVPAGEKIGYILEQLEMARAKGEVKDEKDEKILTLNLLKGGKTCFP